MEKQHVLARTCQIRITANAPIVIKKSSYDRVKQTLPKVGSAMASLELVLSSLISLTNNFVAVFFRDIAGFPRAFT